MTPTKRQVFISYLNQSSGIEIMCENSYYYPNTVVIPFQPAFFNQQPAACQFPIFESFAYAQELNF